MSLSRVSKIPALALLLSAASIVTPVHAAASDSMASPSSASATASAAPDISGVYVCSGNDVTDKSQYTVELTVTKSGDVYLFKGAEKGIDNKAQNFLGTGLFAKNSNTTIASTFWQTDNPTISGVVIHQIQPDGTWQGVWTWRDKVGVNTETCQKK